MRGFCLTLKEECGDARVPRQGGSHRHIALHHFMVQDMEHQTYLI